MPGMAGEENTTMESFLSRVTTLKCPRAFLSCASTILGERVKDVNKIRLSVFLFAAGQILKGKVGWGLWPEWRLNLLETRFSHQLVKLTSYLLSTSKGIHVPQKIVLVDTGYWKGAPPLFAVSKDQLPRVSG